MNLLDFFKPQRTDLEIALEDTYYNLFSNTGIKRSELRRIIQQEKRISIKGGEDKLPQNFGDFILENYNKGNDLCKKIVEEAINGGANHDDIKQWWNLYDLERRMIKWEDNVFRLMSFKSGRSDGMTVEEAAETLRKSFPIYGDPTDESHFQGEDRPLPDELHERVNKIAAELGNEHMSKAQKEFSSMNAFIRMQIKKKEHR